MSQLQTNIGEISPTEPEPIQPEIAQETPDSPPESDTSQELFPLLREIPKPGDILMFFYTKRLYQEIHDPRPLVIITDWCRPNRSNEVRGVNLHYLTYNDMSTLIQMANRKQIQSYQQSIKFNKWWSECFRTYLINFIDRSSIRKMNFEYLQNKINQVRLASDPNTQHAMRESIRTQAERETSQPQATGMAEPNLITGTIPGTPPVPTTKT